MKIAIIGAGFAGLATAFHLFNQQITKDQIKITLFDKSGIGSEASGIAAGLLHPFGGLHAKLNSFGNEAFNHTEKLLKVSEKTLGFPCYTTSGLLRAATTASQEKDYLKCSKTHPNVLFLKKEDSQKLNPALTPFPCIFIEKAISVYTDLYLKGLFLTCQNLGLKFEKTKINAIDELKHFDKVIVTAGAQTCLFAELSNLQLFLVKGQVLEVEWPKEIESLKTPINSKTYIVMNRNKKTCTVGATYERDFLNPLSDKTVAESLLIPSAIQLIPKLKNANILECRAALRVSTKDHLPLISQINNRLFVFTGLGSKGLLYHSFFAEKLAMLCTKGV